METKIKWNEGEGYITATYEGSGSGSASISSDVNEGIDREQSIKVETTDKSVSATLLVSQEGLREVFEPSDGEFILADGGTYNVLKSSEQQKPVNQLRLALASTGRFIRIVSADTMDLPCRWDYPVESDMSTFFVYDDGSTSGNLMPFLKGEQDYNTVRYFDTEAIGIECSPKEDDYYKYEVILKRL
jgi:hypothetical protein